MRVFSNTFELMSELGREINNYGFIVKPKHYQNKVIEGNDDFITKELMNYSYCLLHLDTDQWDTKPLFAFTKDKDWAWAEFNERVNEKLTSPESLNPGIAWELRKDLWEQFLDEKGKFDYTYAERIKVPALYKGQLMSQLNAIVKLLKDDQDTRKAILSIYNATIDMCRLDGSKRIPCSMYYHFMIRENTKGRRSLHMIYNQRSADYINHFGNDVYLAWLLKEQVRVMLNDALYLEIAQDPKAEIDEGYLYHNISSLHAYKKDWPLLGHNLEDLIKELH